MGGWRSHKYFYFYIGLAVVAALSFGLRFWGLGRFDDLIFDEVYYAKFAQGYSRGEAIFDAHPPLGKYAIALGIWLHSHLSPYFSLYFSPHFKAPLGPYANELMLHPVSYRWVNAFVGSLVPLLVVWIGWMLTGTARVWRHCWFVILAGVFVAIDGLFVTESRYALINIYVVFFGLLGQGLWLCANRLILERQKRLLRLLSGLALGAAIATKWNGLGYLLSLGLWEVWGTARDTAKRLAVQPFSAKLLAKFLARSMLFYGFFLGVLPVATYCLIWQPHLNLSNFSFVGVHQTLLSFHQGLDTFQVTCSQWFTWPLLIKPMAYSYVDAGAKVFTVNNLGNPALWWLSGAAVLLVLTASVVTLKRRFTNGEIDNSDGVQTYLLIGYLANWLPWMVVDRCTYIYLFMPAAVYGFMLLAWLLSGWLTVGGAESRWMGLVMLGVIALSFFFWLPLSLGLPLTPEQLQLRWWLPSWI